MFITELQKTMFIATVIYPLFVFLGYFVLVKFKLFPFWRKYPSDVPPGSMGWPLIGDTLAILMAGNTNSLVDYLLERCSRYGLVFKCSPFGAPTIVSCDLDLNAFILQNEGRLFSSDYPKTVRKGLGEQTILFASGQLHKRLRSIAVSFINTSQTSPDFHSYIDKLSSTMMKSWKNKGLKEIVFLKEAKLFTFRLILKSVLDLDMDMDREDANATKIQEDAFKVTKGFISLPIYFPGNSYARAINARTRMRSVVSDVISERLKRKQTSDQSKEFIDEFLSKVEWNDEEKLETVLSLLIGGYETTAELLAYAVYFLSHSPRAVQELREENKSLRRNKKEGEPLSLEDYKKMVFTLKVINESLRCGSVAKYVFRKALTDIEYKGFVIPSGWKVIPFFTGTHMNPSLHENPSEFNPWRWEDEETKRKVALFGGGPRLCPGAESAKISAAFFLHHFVLNFSWQIRADECPVSPPFLDFGKEWPLQIEPVTL